MGPDSGSLILNPSEKQTVCSFQLGSVWTSLALLTRVCLEEVSDIQTQGKLQSLLLQSRPREFYTKLELNSLVKPLWLPQHF